ncbi:UNVERIFIED_CONTAM: hypothetical protein K2H54_056023 [Gekko kuhli]
MNRKTETSGNLSAIDPAHPEFWEAWVEQIMNFFKYQEITNVGKKKALLLSTCAVATVRMAQGLLAPKKLADATYDEIIKDLMKYTHPSRWLSAWTFLRASRGLVKQPPSSWQNSASLLWTVSSKMSKTASYPSLCGAFGK